MADVSLQKLFKRFGKVEVLHGIDLDIADGEFVVLVGPSGCGKSTTLRMIAGLEDATSGDISIGGRVVNHVDPKDRNIAMVFQNYAIYPHMSVAKNIAFGLRTAKMPRADKDKRVRETADMLGLADLLDRRPSQLSGGQRQRVAMGRAMVRDPAVFLFDEPLSNLDAQLRAQMRLEIKKLHQSVGTTIIFVTHDQVEAMTLADRIVIMREGNIEQIGTPNQVYETPASTFVARFIGSPSMNMIDARMEPDGLHLLDAQPFACPAPQGPLTIGIRPDDLTVGDPGKHHLQGKVSVVEPLGHDAIVYADVAGQELIAKADGRNAPRPAEQVALNFDPARLHLFGAENGVRVAD